MIDGPLVLGGVRVVPIPLWHGRMPVLGFRFGRFAYLTDCNRLDDAAWPLLEGVDTLVVDALRDRPHPTHFNVAEAIGVIETGGAAARLPGAHDARSGARGDPRPAARRRGPGI